MIVWGPSEDDTIHVALNVAGPVEAPEGEGEMALHQQEPVLRQDKYLFHLQMKVSFFVFRHEHLRNLHPLPFSNFIKKSFFIRNLSSDLITAKYSLQPLESFTFLNLPPFSNPHSS